MRTHYILFTLAVVAGIVTVIATYRFGTLPRYERYQQLQEEEELLRQKISDLEKKFSRTRPAAVVELWQEQVQPWAQAVSMRLNYFNTLSQDAINVEVPEEHKEIPKLWYEQERERRMDALEQELFNANLVLAGTALRDHVPPEAGGPGSNPDAASVEEWLESYERAASFVREMIDANAQEIVDLKIWPSDVIMPAPEGTIHRERVGYEIIISMDEFARYLGDMHRSDTYASISALQLSKEGALSDADAPIRAAFVLDRTRFIPTETDTGDEEAAPVIRRRTSVQGGALGAGGGGAGGRVTFSEEELARIRAATAAENPGFFRGILRWFGI